METREVRIQSYMLQALEAAKLMAQEIARHPGTCVIWIFGDECDCGYPYGGPHDPPQCETPEGE